MDNYTLMLAEKVFSNPLIISKIYRQLPFQEAKSCLLLKRIWVSTGITNFKEAFKTVTCLKGLDDMKDYTSLMNSQPEESRTTTQTEFRFSSSLNLSHPQNRETLKGFLAKFGSRIKWIDAHIDYGTGSQLALFFSSLRQLENLVELRLRLHQTRGRFVSSSKLVFGNTKLQSVTKLRLNYESYSGKDGPANFWSNCNFLRQFLLDIFPNLACLELPLNIKGTVDRKVQYFTDTVTYLMYRDQRQMGDLYRMPFPKIKQAGFMLTVVFSRPYPEGLEELEFYDSCFWTNNVSRKVTNMLEHANSATIKKLKMPINLLKRLEGENIHLGIPRMENLEELELEFILRGDNINVPALMGINVAQTLPNLINLKIEITFLGWFCSGATEKVNNIFIPKISTTSKKMDSAFISGSLKKLEIVSHFDRSNATRNSMIEWRHHISTFFPNLKHFANISAHIVHNDGQGFVFSAV